jgi:uncharacterized protein YdbL (DUF1318 family)
MTARRLVATVWLVLASLLVAMSTAAADNPQERMAARVPAILKLKTAGVVGENNLGFLEFRGSSREGADVVAAENQDRKAAYEAIARKTGASLEQVGKRMALKRVERAEAGEWVQMPDGRWTQK